MRARAKPRDWHSVRPAPLSVPSALASTLWCANNQPSNPYVTLGAANAPATVHADASATLTTLGSLVAALTLTGAGLAMGRAVYRRRQHAPLSSKVYGSVRYQKIGTSAPITMVEVSQGSINA